MRKQFQVLIVNDEYTNKTGAWVVEPLETFIHFATSMGKFHLDAIVTSFLKLFIVSNYIKAINSVNGFKVSQT